MMQKKIEGELTVRKANDGEKFAGLNGKEYLLNKDISVIAGDKIFMELLEL